jgi:hypothetical protein
VNAQGLRAPHAHVESDLQKLLALGLDELGLGLRHLDQGGKQERLRRHGPRLILPPQPGERNALGCGVLIQKIEAVVAFTEQVRLANLCDEAQAGPRHVRVRDDRRLA